MISILSNNGKQHYGLQQYLCDTEDDIAYLPKDAVPGSTALVASPYCAFVLNNQKEWIKVQYKGSSTGGSGTTIIEKLVWGELK